MNEASTTETYLNVANVRNYNQNKMALRVPKRKQPEETPFPSENARERYEEIYSMTTGGNGLFYGPVRTFICRFGDRMFYIFGDHHTEDKVGKLTCNNGVHVEMQDLLENAFKSALLPADFIFELFNSPKGSTRELPKRSWIREYRNSPIGLINEKFKYQFPTNPKPRSGVRDFIQPSPYKNVRFTAVDMRFTGKVIKSEETVTYTNLLGAYWPESNYELIKRNGRNISLGDIIAISVLCAFSGKFIVNYVDLLFNFSGVNILDFIAPDETGLTVDSLINALAAKGFMLRPNNEFVIDNYVRSNRPIEFTGRGRAYIENIQQIFNSEQTKYREIKGYIALWIRNRLDPLLDEYDKTVNAKDFLDKHNNKVNMIGIMHELYQSFDDGDELISVKRKTFKLLKNKFLKIDKLLTVISSMIFIDIFAILMFFNDNISNEVWVYAGDAHVRNYIDFLQFYHNYNSDVKFNIITEYYNKDKCQQIEKLLPAFKFEAMGEHYSPLKIRRFTAENPPVIAKGDTLEDRLKYKEFEEAKSMWHTKRAKPEGKEDLAAQARFFPDFKE